MMAGIIMILLALICNINIIQNLGKVTIPRHKGDVKKGTLNSILKQAGIKKIVLSNL